MYRWFVSFVLFLLFFFFFKQKTAYEMRISDWSSDVCPSDLSFTQAFAYDHFQWPALKMFGSARPSVMEFREPAERADEERGVDRGDDHAVQLYTTKHSDIPIYMTDRQSVR